ncbi:MAG: preprotein translocase subunit SecG, partial [Alphaproteobacteria bacterium]|nr:preprotein translocase subunit SecG [Alphaproteobacteria bacterium]
MTTVILVIHLLLAIGLVGIILIQRSEGGGLGIGGGGGGGGGGMGGFMTGRAAADLLTRTTAIIAAAFMVTS